MVTAPDTRNKQSKTTCDTCDGQLGVLEVSSALFHLHLFGTLVVVFVQHIRHHAPSVTHNFLDHVLRQVSVWNLYSGNGPAREREFRVRRAKPVLRLVRRLVKRCASPRFEVQSDVSFSPSPQNRVSLKSLGLSVSGKLESVVLLVACQSGHLIELATERRLLLLVTCVGVNRLGFVVWCVSHFVSVLRLSDTIDSVELELFLLLRCHGKLIVH